MNFYEDLVVAVIVLNGCGTAFKFFKMTVENIGKESFTVESDPTCMAVGFFD